MPSLREHEARDVFRPGIVSRAGQPRAGSPGKTSLTNRTRPGPTRRCRLGVLDPRMRVGALRLGLMPSRAAVAPLAGEPQAEGVPPSVPRSAGVVPGLLEPRPDAWGLLVVAGGSFAISVRFQVPSPGPRRRRTACGLSFGLVQGTHAS